MQETTAVVKRLVAGYRARVDALEIMNGSQDGKRLLLEGDDEWLVGRSDDADLIVTDPSVSRRHAQITRREGQYYVEDVASTHGTIVNGQLVEGNKRLDYGDQILAGSTMIELIEGGGGDDDENPEQNDHRGDETGDKPDTTEEDRP